MGEPLLRQAKRRTARRQEQTVVGSSKNCTTVRCACGRVELEAGGDPIMSAVCYCGNCQEGSHRIAALPDGRPVCGPDGGTWLVLYRKDRVARSKGAELLRGLKNREESPTSRVVAACCDSPLYLDFEKGHWLSVYRAALGEDAPPPQMRVQTKSRPAGIDLPDDVPAYPGYPLKFLTKLLAARIAMLLGR
jgi:hypothetical protein